MSEDMNLSVNGHSKVPPGFRFHPTEEELLHYYLRKKVASDKIDLDVIRDVDLNKLEPWDIQEKCKIGSTPQNDWYFFSHKDKKYPTGTRTNRATAAGFWKATGRDKVIQSNCRRIGMRKTLVFYRGRAPHGQKSDWIMHEYRLDDNTTTNDHGSNMMGAGESGQEEGWVVCRVFKKKNYHKALESPCSSNNSLQLPRNDGVLDQILKYMGRSSSSSSSSCKQEVELPSTLFPNQNHHHQSPNFLHLPELESPSMQQQVPSSSDWATLDRLVASQLNGHPSEDLSFSFEFINMHDSHRTTFDLPTDLWNFARSDSSSSSDPLSHLSV